MDLMGGLYTLLKQKGFEMKIFDTIGSAYKATKKFLVEQKDKALVALGLAMSGVAPTASNAADIAYAEATGFTGTFNLTPFYSAIGIVVVAIGVVAAIKLALGTFKRV